MSVCITVHILTAGPNINGQCNVLPHGKLAKKKYDVQITGFGMEIEQQVGKVFS